MVENGGGWEVVNSYLKLKAGIWVFLGGLFLGGLGEGMGSAWGIGAGMQREVGRSGGWLVL